MSATRRAIVRIGAVAGLLVIAAVVVEYVRNRQIREDLYAAVTPIQITNCELQRFGAGNDGGYLMCGNLLTRSQAAYSYGIDGRDEWGCEVASALNIPLHQYDCFNTDAPRCDGGGVVPEFHAECVGPGRDTIDGRPFDTIANHLVTNGDTGKRLVVKMDVEGSEWTSLVSAPDHVLDAIDQLAIEFHRVESRAYLDTIARLAQFFYVAHYHQNNYECHPGFEPFAGPVFEILLVNKRVAAANPQMTAWGPSPLDAPNNPRMPDCQVPLQRSETDRIIQWTRRKVRAAVDRFR